MGFDHRAGLAGRLGARRVLAGSDQVGFRIYLGWKNAAGAEALADSPYLGGLLYLNLFGNRIGAYAAHRLRARFGDRVILQ